MELLAGARRTVHDGGLATTYLFPGVPAVSNNKQGYAALGRRFAKRAIELIRRHESK
jgi:hypothetical protein